VRHSESGDDDNDDARSAVRSYTFDRYFSVIQPVNGPF